MKQAGVFLMLVGFIALCVAVGVVVVEFFWPSVVVVPVEGSSI